MFVYKSMVYLLWRKELLFLILLSFCGQLVQPNMELRDLESNVLKRILCTAKSELANKEKSPYHILVLAKKALWI